MLPITRRIFPEAHAAADGKSSLRALHEALDNLENMTEAIAEAYTASLEGGDYERPEDLEYDFESVNDRLWADKEAKGLGTRAEFEAAKKEREEKEKVKDVKPKKGKSIKVGR